MTKALDGKLVGILGAGSIGCYVGGSLQNAGCRVRFFGREHMASNIAATGLTLTSHVGSRFHLPAGSVDFRMDMDGLNECDIVLVCVKSAATQEAAASIAGRGKPGAVVISLQNGVSNANVLDSLLQDQVVLAGSVAFNVAKQKGAHFHLGTDGDVVVGEHPVARELVETLNEAGIAARTDANMQGVLWGKLLLNLNNGLNVLADKPLRQQLLDRDYRRVLALLIEETLKVLDAAGIRPAKIGKAPPRLMAPILRLPNWLFERVAAGMLKIDDKARSSMRDDLDRGRKSEISYINGAVVDLAGKVGVSVPVNAAVIALVEDAFVKGQSPGIGGRDLLRRIHGAR